MMMNVEERKKEREQRMKHRNELEMLRIAVGRAASEMGRVLGVSVRSHDDLETMLKLKSLPCEPFHTVLSIDDCPAGQHFVYAKLAANLVLEVHSTNRETHPSVVGFSGRLCSKLSISLGKPVVAVVIENFSEDVSVRSTMEASLNDLANALGTKLSFTHRSVANMASRVKVETTDGDGQEGFAPETQDTWLAWAGSLFHGTLPNDDAKGNQLRIVRVVRAVSRSIMEHTGGEGAEEACRRVQSAVFDIEERLYEAMEENPYDCVYEDMSDEESDTAPVQLLVIKQWVATLCSKIPLDSPAITNHTPDYKMAWYKMMANTDPTIYYQF